MSNILVHHGIKGMRWGVRRYQNPDGSLTSAGKNRYINSDGTLTKKGIKRMKGGFNVSLRKQIRKSQTEIATEYANKKVEKSNIDFSHYRDSKGRVKENLVSGYVNHVLLTNTSDTSSITRFAKKQKEADEFVKKYESAPINKLSGKITVYDNGYVKAK